jgi:hypothetical protein
MSLIVSVYCNFFLLENWRSFANLEKFSIKISFSKKKNDDGNGSLNAKLFFDSPIEYITSPETVCNFSKFSIDKDASNISDFPFSKLNFNGIGPLVLLSVLFTNLMFIVFLIFNSRFNNVWSDKFSKNIPIWTLFWSMIVGTPPYDYFNVKLTTFILSSIHNLFFNIFFFGFFSPLRFNSFSFFFSSFFKSSLVVFLYSLTL